MKCTRCQKDKEPSEFRPNKNRSSGYQFYCKDCDKEFQREWYQKNKVRLIEKNVKRNKEVADKLRQYILNYLKSHPCVHCGEEDPVVLEFDHLRDKEMTISRMITHLVSVEKLQLEIDKCQVLCANCHKRKTAKDQNWYKVC